MPVTMPVNRFKKTFRICIVCYSLLFTSIMTFSQQEKVPIWDCQRLDITRNSLYIQFERSGLSTEGDKKEHLTWLRFRNNISCTVYLEIIGLYYRLVDGKATNQILDGEELHVNFLLETITGRKAHYKTNNFGVVCLLPGRSVVFDLPSKYLEKGYRIIVPFGFNWNGSWGMNGNPRYEVFFDTVALPRGWEKNILSEHRIQIKTE
jgi:hypothetical protein